MISVEEVNIIRDEPVVIKNPTVPHEPVSAEEVRELYRNRADSFVNRLKVAVRKNYNPPISFDSYQNEIANQNGLMRQILYLQNCRAAIEQAVECGRGEVVGENSTTTFIRQEDGFILVTRT